MRLKVLFLCVIFSLSVLGAVSSFAAETVVVGATASTPALSPTRPMSKWLHMLDKSDAKRSARSSILAFAPEVPGDLTRVLRSVSADGSSPTFTRITSRAIISIVIGFFLGFILKLFMKGPVGRLEKLRPPSDEHFAVILASVLRQIPTIVITLAAATFAIAIFLFIDKQSSYQISNIMYSIVFE